MDSKDFAWWEKACVEFNSFLIYIFAQCLKVVAMTYLMVIVVYVTLLLRMVFHVFGDFWVGRMIAGYKKESPEIPSPPLKEHKEDTDLFGTFFG